MVTSVTIIRIMKIEEIKTNLPREKENIDNFYENCKKRKKFIIGSKDNYKFHLKKGKHDLFRAIKEFEDECWDWTVIKAYYSIHHAANALLLKKEGIFCKDHSCLIIALKHHKLLSEDISKELSELHESFSDIFGLDLTFQLRKLSQYDVYEWENIKREDAELIIKAAKKIISFTENA